MFNHLIKKHLDQKKAKLALRLALMFLGLIISFLFIEILLRATEKKIYDLSSCVSLDKNFHHVMVPNSKCRYKTSEWDVTYQINNLGLRNNEITPKSKDTFRVLFLGDSYVQGHGLETDQSFVNILENKLNNANFSQKIEVINAGVFGYSPLIEYLFLKEIGLSLEPDLVITGFNVSDFYEDRKRFAELKTSYPNLSDKELEQKIKNGEAVFDFSLINQSAVSEPTQKIYLPVLSFSVKQWFRENSKIYKTVSDFIKKKNQPIQQDVLYQGDMDLDFAAIMRGSKIKEEDYQRLWDLPLKHLTMMSEALNQKDIPFIVFTIPDATQVSDREWPNRKALGYAEHFQDTRLPFQEVLKEKLKDSKIIILDPLEEYKNNKDFPLYFPIDGHFNQNGSQLAAEFLYKNLISQSVILGSSALQNDARIWSSVKTGE